MQVFVLPTRKWPQKNAENTKAATSIFVFSAFFRGNSMGLRRKPRWVRLCQLWPALNLRLKSPASLNGYGARLSCVVKNVLQLTLAGAHYDVVSGSKPPPWCMEYLTEGIVVFDWRLVV
jgi:hypothetical protein